MNYITQVLINCLPWTVRIIKWKKQRPRELKEPWIFVLCLEIQNVSRVSYLNPSDPQFFHFTI